MNEFEGQQTWEKYPRKCRKVAVNTVEIRVKNVFNNRYAEYKGSQLIPWNVLNLQLLMQTNLESVAFYWYSHIISQIQSSSYDIPQPLPHF